MDKQMYFLADILVRNNLLLQYTQELLDELAILVGSKEKKTESEMRDLMDRLMRKCRNDSLQDVDMFESLFPDPYESSPRYRQKDGD